MVERDAAMTPQHLGTGMNNPGIRTNGIVIMPGMDGKPSRSGGVQHGRTNPMLIYEQPGYDTCKDGVVPDTQQYNRGSAGWHMVALVEIALADATFWGVDKSTSLLKRLIPNC
jgi:hypothetical protein